MSSGDQTTVKIGDETEKKEPLETQTLEELLDDVDINIGKIHLKLQESSAELANNAFTPDGMKVVSGEFSVVYPIGNGFAVKWQKKPDLNGDLAREAALLQHLNTHDIPAIKTYGGVFQINGRDAVVMDWIDGAKLIDAKSPENAKLILYSVLLGINIPTGEAWAMHYNDVQAEVTAKTLDPDFDLERLQMRSAQFADQFALLSQNLNTKKLAIGDLQILISSMNGIHVRVIDPLDVLQVSKTDYYLKPTDLAPIEPQPDTETTRRKLINAEYVSIIEQGNKMIAAMLVECKLLSQVNKENLTAHILKALDPTQQSQTLKKSIHEINAGGLDARSVAQSLLHRGSRSVPVTPRAKHKFSINETNASRMRGFTDPDGLTRKRGHDPIDEDRSQSPKPEQENISTNLGLPSKQSKQEASSSSSTAIQGKDEVQSDIVLAENDPNNTKKPGK